MSRPLLKMQQDIRNLKQKMQCCGDRPMFSPSLVKLGSRTPEKLFCPTLKNCTPKRAKSAIGLTQPWII